MDHPQELLIAYVLLTGLIVLSVFMGNLDEHLNMTHGELLAILFLFTVVPGILLVALSRRT